MSGIDWLVIAGGAAAILWVNWYFFLAERGGNGPRAKANDTSRGRG